MPRRSSLVDYFDDDLDFHRQTARQAGDTEHDMPFIRRGFSPAKLQLFLDALKGWKSPLWIPLR